LARKRGNALERIIFISQATPETAATTITKTKAKKNYSKKKLKKKRNKEIACQQIAAAKKPQQTYKTHTHTLKYLRTHYAALSSILPSCLFHTAALLRARASVAECVCL